MKKILIVEDEEELVKALQIRLERENFETIIASDGEEGLRKAKEESPDLIILDIILPRMDGYAVCRTLKNDEKYKEIPIIMLTVKAQKQDIATGYKGGVNLYITKPFDIQELISSVKTLINANPDANSR